MLLRSTNGKVPISTQLRSLEVVFRTSPIPVWAHMHKHMMPVGVLLYLVFW